MNGDHPRAPAEVVIGLDVGTTAVKAVAFGLGGSSLHGASREYATHAPHGSLAASGVPGVQDPAMILVAATGALSECVAATRGASVLAVSVSAAMHGLIALDRERAPLTPLLTWADQRADAEAWALHRSGEARTLHALTGVPIHPMTPLAKLLWFARHDPGTWSRARWWAGLKDYLLLWLTGRLVTELSSASGTGLLEMSARTWSPAALEVCGVSVDRLPEILPTTATLEIAATTAVAVGLPVGTAVVAGAADGPLGNLGTGAISAGIAGLSLGTSGALRIAVSEPQVDDGLFCYALTESLWVVGGALSNGGAVMRWVGRSLVPEIAGAAGANADESILELAAGVPPGSDGLLMLPFLLAERAPLWSPELHGAYLGLRADHTRAHFARAALEGVCIQMRIILGRLDSIDEIRAVRATGGAFRSQLWRSVMAATLGRPLSIVDDANGTARGAAALGLYALGRASSLNGALAALRDAAGSPTSPTPGLCAVDAGLVALYEGVLASVAERIRGLSNVADAIERVGYRRRLPG